MKDEEWGAVAYLSHSKYGIDKQVRINNNNGFRTGCGASIEDGAASANCEITYGMVNEYPQSTTGNITGIFDMSGGAYEYTMGILVDPNGKPRSGYTSRPYTEAQINGLTGISTTYTYEINSGYNGMVYGKSESGETLYKTNGESFPHEKHYTLYQTSNRLTACGGKKCLGKTLVETNNWYGDFNYFINAVYPWFLRGGGYSHATGSGLLSVDIHNGSAECNMSFRVVSGV
ncbi:MAG: hypothetical protein RR732_03530 [Bacilli bacterium]